MGSPQIPYFLRRRTSESCGYYGGRNIDLTVDVMFLTGLVHLKNPDSSTIAIDAHTRYSAFDKAADAATQIQYDFNGDGTPDHVVEGKMLPQSDANGDPIVDHNNEPVFTLSPKTS